MKIQDQDIYHGPALMQIVEHPSFKALNKTDAKYGHYTVNNDRRLFVKYSKARNGPWAFTFNADDLAQIQRDRKAVTHVFVCLVCSNHSICCLSYAELDEIIDVTKPQAQGVKVESRRGGSMWVWGPEGDLSHAIAHNSFPNKVLE